MQIYQLTVPLEFSNYVPIIKHILRNIMLYNYETTETTNATIIDLPINSEECLKEINDLMQNLPFTAKFVEREMRGSS